MKVAYKCDLDGDGIPDVCDIDIDNDGVPNLL
ncbi:MAG: thrombospondin type 3 repeat-containing protein [bacterium]